MTEFTMVAKPFDWNDNLSEVALEDFSMIQNRLPYGVCQTIGMALEKLELLEKQRAEVKERKMFKKDVVNCVIEHLDKWYASANHKETAIQLVDEYEERIRADERRKFVEWMHEKAYFDDFYYKSVDDILSEYEKENNNA